MEQEKKNPEVKNEQVEAPVTSATKQAEQSPANNGSTEQAVNPQVNPQTTAQETNGQLQPEAKQYRFDPDKIDWDSAKAFGLTKEKLVNANVLDTLLQ